MVIEGHEIRVFHDYGVGLPLWDDLGEMDESDLDLSPELTALLATCTYIFETAFDPETGWCDGRARRTYAEAMATAVAALRRELAGIVEVVDEHEWCLAERKH